MLACKSVLNKLNKFRLTPNQLCDTKTKRTNDFFFNIVTTNVLILVAKTAMVKTSVKQFMHKAHGNTLRRAI